MIWHRGLLTLERSPNNLSDWSIGRLSHYAFIGAADGAADQTEVPEPGSLALAGLGLLGLFAARKKFSK